MNIEDIRYYALSLNPVVEETFPFADDTLIFKICGKWFLVAPLEKPNMIVLKVVPEVGEELRTIHQGISQAWHFNKRHWIQVDISMVGDALIKRLITDSYMLVVAKLPKRLRQSLQAVQ